MNNGDANPNANANANVVDAADDNNAGNVGNDGNAGNAVNAVNAVAVKLPTWWPDQPEVWFARVDAIFRQRNITADATQFDHVLATLDNDAATRVLDVIRAPPAGRSYQALRDRLVGALALTDFERACKIIDGLTLGDDKPSMLMDRMLAVYGPGQPDFLFRAHFLLKLPESVREHLHQDAAADLHALAKRADNQWALRKSSTAAPVLAGNLDNINAIRNPKDPKRPQKSRNTTTPSMCFYHAKFGDQAQKCRQPCSYTGSSGNANAGRQ